MTNILMKPIVITVHLQCRDDVPVDVLNWMAENLAAHAAHEFGNGYDPEWTGYDRSPLLYSRIHAHAALDTAVLENERVWRRAGAPPSSVVVDPTDPAA
jgi:hypothetical protein